MIPRVESLDDVVLIENNNSSVRRSKFEFKKDGSIMVSSKYNSLIDDVETYFP